MSSVLVVYSGGLDSYTLLNKAMKNFDRVEAITFNYGQKHNKEIEYAKSNCAELNIKHEVVNLDLENILAGSALVGDIDIPEGNYDKEKMKQTIVPNRNMIMISVAASLVIKNDIEYLWYAAHSGDHEIYPDCRPEFIDKMENLSKRLGLPQKLREVNIPKNACEKMARDAMKQTRLLINNPRELTENDALNIYQSAW